jgi:hypothetical protein
VATCRRPACFFPEVRRLVFQVGGEPLTAPDRRLPTRTSCPESLHSPVSSRAHCLLRVRRSVRA